MRYVDLFAGLGGFHLALDELGHECVFASEIDKDLRELYRMNFGMSCSGDINLVDPRDIPPHDILCAGFPCQPFSKAGRQEGLDHPKLGKLYLQILKVIKVHKPSYVLLENVPNLKNHGNGRSWAIIKKMLEEEGYNVDIKEISPHQYGIPQIRYRVYIVASLKPLEDISKRLKLGRRPKKIDLKSVLLTLPQDYRPVPKELMEKIDAWQEFLDLIPKGESFPLPLWGMEFGATYPFEDTTPFIMSLEELRSYRGSFGHKIIAASDKSEALSMLPSYARTPQERFPEWKVKYIRNSRDFFLKHKDLLSQWSKKIEKFNSSCQKFEWNCHEKNPLDEDRELSNYVVQLRPSGIRVKRPSTSPALVAMNMTQVPIIMWEKRYISPSECKRLQSMDKLKYLPNSWAKAYSSLGNAVNVAVARRVALAVVGRAYKRQAGTGPSKVNGQLECLGIEEQIMER